MNIHPSKLYIPDSHHHNNRRTAQFIVAILILSLSPGANAQPAWKWGRTSPQLSESWGIAADNKGNVYATGENSTAFAATFGAVSAPAPTPSTTQVAWVKYNTSGTPLWADATLGNDAYLYNIATDTSGNLFVFGRFTGDTLRIGAFTLMNPVPAHNPYFLAKVSPAGTVLWAVADGNVGQYMDPALAQIMLSGGSGAVATDDTGNVYITGEFRAATMTVGATTLTNASAGTDDIFIVKYSPAGTLLCARSAGGTLNDYVFGITTDAAINAVVIAGAFKSPTLTFGDSILTDPYTTTRAFVAAYTSGGAAIGAVASGGHLGAYASCITHDDTGNLYVAGGFSDTSISLGASALTRDVLYAFPNVATFIVQLLPTGAVSWGKTISSFSQPVYPYSIAYSSCGIVWLSAGYSDTAVLDAGDTLQVVAGAGGDPCLIAGYSHISGDVADQHGLNSGGDDMNSITVNAAGDVFVCGDFEGVSLIAGPDTLPPSGVTIEQFFVSKYSMTGDTLHAISYASICGLASTVLTAPASVYYLWDNGATTQTRTVTAAGNYVVLGTGCGGEVTADTFHVSNQPPSAIAGSSLLPICSTTTLVDSLIGGTWSSGATAVATIDPVTGVITPHSLGPVNITYTAGACSVTTEEVVVLCEGVPSVTQSGHLLISPNPATDYFTIQTSPGAYTYCTIINNLGQVVITQPIVATQTRVDVSLLPAGIYYIRLKGEADTRVEQIVVSH